LQIAEKIRRLGGLGRGGEDGAVVGFQDSQPVFDVGGA